MVEICTVVELSRFGMPFKIVWFLDCFCKIVQYSKVCYSDPDADWSLFFLGLRFRFQKKPRFFAEENRCLTVCVMPFPVEKGNDVFVVVVVATDDDEPIEADAVGVEELRPDNSDNEVAWPATTKKELTFAFA